MIITAATSAPAWADQNFAVHFVGTATNLTAAPGDGGASVSWTPPTLDQGTPLTTYTLKVYNGATLVKSVVVPGSATSALVTGLTNGTTYTFTVTANAVVGFGNESAHSNAVTPSRAAAQAPPSAASPSRLGTKPAPPNPGPPPR
jgi:hypothetical protein